MDQEFWRGKRVFLTGHTGFKGSWLSLWLQKLGAHTVGYALAPPTTPSFFNVAKLADGMTSISGDVRDLTKLKQACIDCNPDIVIHMAAQPLVLRSYEDPVETYGTNVMGTVHLLEAVRACKNVRAVIIVTSDKCYENREWVWGYREDEAMGGYDPYSNSKGCAELVTSAYRNSFFCPDKYDEHGVAIASVRAGNVIGGGDWAENRLMPDIIKAIINDKPVMIRNPRAIRPWQHVLEPLHGYLCLAERLWKMGADYSGGWNFGPNDDDVKEVSWIVEKITNLWGDGARWETDEKQYPHEANCLKLDCSKARYILDWSPKIDLSTAIEWIVAWFRSYQQRDDMFQVSASQITSYENINKV